MKRKIEGGVSTPQKTLTKIEAFKKMSPPPGPSPSIFSMPPSLPPLSPRPISQRRSLEETMVISNATPPRARGPLISGRLGASRG